jgi:hypothetical protein
MLKKCTPLGLHGSFLRNTAIMTINAMMIISVRRLYQVHHAYT